MHAPQSFSKFVILVHLLVLSDFYVATNNYLRLQTIFFKPKMFLHAPAADYFRQMSVILLIAVTVCNGWIPRMQT